MEEITLVNESRSEWLLRAFEKAGKDLKRISKFGKMEINLSQ
jgi:hypothetical protein